MVQEGWESLELRGKNNKYSALRVIVKDPITGFSIIMKTPEEIVEAAAKSNLHHQFQTEGTSFWLAPLLNAFEFCAKNEENCNTLMDGSFVPSEDTDHL